MRTESRTVVRLGSISHCCGEVPGHEESREHQDHRRLERVRPSEDLDSEEVEPTQDAEDDEVGVDRVVSPVTEGLNESTDIDASEDPRA